ncbi:uncharacterized protein [Parasteatoda tepidariorum]|uniref:uncharacterized protein n=1 Tax=Parasteatoda tepidariorum TaxID=114398 RepID=UPI001C72544B|nr:adhesive plaque matrix protein-like [Parasteatoda tepidariorum]
MLKKVLLLCVSVFCSAQYYGPKYERPKYSSSYAASYEEKPRPYNFGYDVKGDYGSAIHHKEESDSYGYKKGTYGYTDGYGIYRQVDYTADDKGFRAIVKTNEPGTANENPADVRIYSEAKPVKYSNPSTYDKTENINPTYKKTETVGQYYRRDSLSASPYNRAYSGQSNQESRPYSGKTKQDHLSVSDPGKKFYGSALAHPSPKSDSQTAYKSQNYHQAYTPSPIKPTTYSDAYSKAHTYSQPKIPGYGESSVYSAHKRSYSKPSELESSYPKSTVDNSKYHQPSKLDAASKEEQNPYKSYPVYHNRQTYNAPQPKSSDQGGAYPKISAYQIPESHTKNSQYDITYPKAPVYPQNPTYDAPISKVSSKGHTYSETYHSKNSKSPQAQYGFQKPEFGKINENSRHAGVPCPQHSNYDPNAASVQYQTNSYIKQDTRASYRSSEASQSRPTYESKLEYKPMIQVPMYKPEHSSPPRDQNKAIYCQNCAPY